jgi:hypothetical protein
MFNVHSFRNFENLLNNSSSCDHTKSSFKLVTCHISPAEISQAVSKTHTRESSQQEHLKDGLTYNKLITRTGG